MQNYRAKIPNVENGDIPMHTLFIGHNPSIATWQSGHYFANPTNQFWKLVDKSDLLNSATSFEIGEITSIDDDLMISRGFGFTDFIEKPGNDANAITRSEIESNRAIFAKRIEKYAYDINIRLKRICFVGKKQWKQQFAPNLSKCDHGLQEPNMRPKHWPKILCNLEIWVLASPSGRAVISASERLESYQKLAQHLENANVDDNSRINQ